MTDWIVWVAAGLALLIAEMLLPGVFMMWLGLAACGAGVMTLAFHFAFEAQVVTFGVLAKVGVFAASAADAGMLSPPPVGPFTFSDDATAPAGADRFAGGGDDDEFDPDDADAT